MDLKNLKAGDTGTLSNGEVFSMGRSIGSYNKLKIEAERKGLEIETTGNYVSLKSNNSPFGAICLAS